MSTGTIRIDGHRIELKNLDKVLFPKTGLTKGDLIDYYHRIAAVALKHYRNRPLTMHRFPDGIGAEGFFQKDIPDHFPRWIGRARLKKEGGAIDHVIANDAATLVYLANQGCITLHLALSRRTRPQHPDRLIFDLDPSDDDFSKVRSAALDLKALLDALALRSYVQTTGSRGLHVVVPLDGSSDFEHARELARKIADRLVAAQPDALTVEQRKAARGKRVYIDCLRNAYGQTAVAPYAVRAMEAAPIATPLDWDEVGDADLDPQRYTMRNIFRRLGQKADPWSRIGDVAQSVADASSRLDRLG